MEAFLIPLSAALAISVPALATGWAQSRIGPAIAASLAEKPELSTTAILLVAIPGDDGHPGLRGGGAHHAAGRRLTA